MLVIEQEHTYLACRIKDWAQRARGDEYGALYHLSGIQKQPGFERDIETYPKIVP